MKGGGGSPSLACHTHTRPPSKPDFQGPKAKPDTNKARHTTLSQVEVALAFQLICILLSDLAETLRKLATPPRNSVLRQVLTRSRGKGCVQLDSM
jgi:hypothetical protein